MKSWIPASLCFAVLFYSCGMAYLARRSYFPAGSSYKVEVTVTGPDGAVIPPAERVPH